VILAADVGGTKTVVGLFAESDEGLECVVSRRYASDEHDSLEEILAHFLAHEAPQDAREVAAACVGIAGAILDGEVRTTNLPWRAVSEASLARAAGTGRVKLLNDLQAAAYGMLFLPTGELALLNDGARQGRRGNVAVIAAGTGLGEASLFWDGERHHPVASEGGHADFAPQTDREIELLRYLRAKFQGHVSWERVLSGPGLSNVYAFLRDAGAHRESAAVADALEAADDPNVVITEHGLEGGDALSAAALDLFCELYGAEAGNMALRHLATGGVFVGGGIAPKLLPVLQAGSFMRGFADKGRFRELLESLDVRVALNPRAPLVGAAHYARRLQP